MSQQDIPPALDEPIPDDPTWLARRVIELETALQWHRATKNQADFWQAQSEANAKHARKAAREVCDLKDENKRLEQDLREVKDERSEYSRWVAGERFEKNEILTQVTSKLDELDARADKLLLEARERQFGDAVIPSDEYFARYRRSLESQIIGRVARELRNVLPQHAEVQHEELPKVWQSAFEPEPPVGTAVKVTRFGETTLWHRRDDGWHHDECPEVCEPGHRWNAMPFPLTEVVA